MYYNRDLKGLPYRLKNKYQATQQTWQGLDNRAGSRRGSEVVHPGVLPEPEKYNSVNNSFTFELLKKRESMLS